MTPEQQAAYVMGQVALLMAEIAGMQAENQYRIARGETIAYGEDAFKVVTEKYPVDHNSVLSLYSGATHDSR